MELTLSLDEAVALKDALDVYLHEFEFEVARTDRPRNQRVLGHRFDQLQLVRDRLNRALATPAGNPDLPAVH